MLEACCHERASFLTLTYAKETLPNDGSLVPSDLQLWLKRFRKAAGPVRYYAVGEYGDQSWRPHYHVALFGRGREASEIVRTTWGKGHTYTGDLTLASAQYVAGYVTKKMTGVGDERLGGKHPEFARMSLRPGIGFPSIRCIAEALQNKHGWEQIENTGDVPQVLRFEQRNLPLGRYMRTHLRAALGHRFVGEPVNVALEKTARLRALYQDYVDAEGSTSMEGFKEYKKEREKQKILNIERRARIKGKVTI